MAAVGGGFSASAAAGGVAASSSVRCRFPGRPCPSRSQLRSERRLHVARLRSGDREAAGKGPGPVSLGLALKEDPSLVRLLRIAEKHRRQREAGFCSSGSEEEDSFPGFLAESKRFLRSGRSESSLLKPESSSQEKPPPAPDLTALVDKDLTTTQKKELKPLYGKIVKKAGRALQNVPSVVTTGEQETTSSSESELKPLFGKIVKRGEKTEDVPSAKVKSQGKASVKPKLIVKFLLKKSTKKGSRQQALENLQGIEDSSKDRLPLGRQTPGLKAKIKQDVGGGKTKSQTRQEQESEAKEVLPQKRQPKVFWTQTRVKGKGRGQTHRKALKSRRRVSQNEKSDGASNENVVPVSQRRNTRNALWASQRRRTKNVLASKQGVAVSPKPVGRQRRTLRDTGASPEAAAEGGVEAGQEPAVPSQEGTSTDPSLQTNKRSLNFKMKCQHPSIGYRRRPIDEKHTHLPGRPVQHRRARRKMVFYSIESDGPAPSSSINLHHGDGTDKPVVSARSSRVIKTPKRFMDDERMSHLTSAKKALQNKTSKDHQEDYVSTSDGMNSSRMQSLDVDQKPFGQKASGNKRGLPELEQTIDEGDGFGTADSTFSDTQEKQLVLSQSSSHLQIYENLKKLTSNLAQKRVQKVSSGESFDPTVETEKGTDDTGDSEGPVKKRRRSKLKVEEIPSPGVLRKLAVQLTHLSPSLPGADEDNASIQAKKSETPVGTGDDLCQEDHGDRVLVEQDGCSHRISLSSKRMFHLLKRAKVQLIKIDQQKQLKSSQLLSGTVKLRGGLETAMTSPRRIPGKEDAVQQAHPLGGPRIKHVCRAAAVALGQPRALVPDDIPRLSALPLHEREGISQSPAEEDEGEVSDPESLSSQNLQPVRVRRPPMYNSRGNRSRRCLRCKGCVQEEDCGRCINCLDKPKFGGPNTKRQCCIYKRCSRIEQKKAMRQGFKFYRVQVRGRRRLSASGDISTDDEDEEAEGGEVDADPSNSQSPTSTRTLLRRRVTPRRYSDLLESHSDTDSSDILVGRKSTTTTPGHDPASTLSGEPSDATKSRRPGFSRFGRRRFDKGPKTMEASATAPPSLCSSLPTTTAVSQSLKLHFRLQLRLERLPPCVVQAAEAGLWTQVESFLHQNKDDHKECNKEEGEMPKELKVGTQGAASSAHLPCLPHSQSSMEHTQPSLLAALANGFPHQGAQSRQPAHRIRVDFKEECSIQNVWLMGGLSILTSVPITSPCVCLLCGSKGQHEMIYCQICCEPFHTFCLMAEERPQGENKENWCCRRCKFCNVCGRKSKHSKPVLQCKRCLFCYHPSCLGPTYPQPVRCNIPWICMTCIRCKSCGVTPGKSSDMAWNHTQDLCPDCSMLQKKGHFCTICLKCYDEEDYDSQMIQCANCAHWVHAKCEGLLNDQYEILSNLPEDSVVYTCKPCSQSRQSLWREGVQMELNSRLGTVLASLLSSNLTRHLLVCAECESHPDRVLEQQSVCDLTFVNQKFEQGLYSSLTSFMEDVSMVITKHLKEEEFLLEEHQRTEQAKSYYMKVLKEAFKWLKVGEIHTKEFPREMLPDAVLPPSSEHSYAKWLEREGGRMTLGEIHTNSKGSLKGGDRQCALCQKFGDAKPNDAGRLLYLGQDEWAHINCCLWSAEVLEDKGALMHVHSAVTRGRFMRCERCGYAGATVGCCLSSCQSNYHFMCARARDCVFQIDRKVYCHKHRYLIHAKTVSGNGFEVLRRVYVDFEGINLRRKFLTGLEPESINVVIGSLQIHKLGFLTSVSANSGKLFPIGYQSSRWYWSTVDPQKRCRYTCKVTEVRPSPSKKSSVDSQVQGQNRTIIHSPNPHKVDRSEDEPISRTVEATPNTPSPNSKQDPGHRTAGYHARKPVGGSSRPLPSPGNMGLKSHHILTVSDLDETRRPRRLCSTTRLTSPPKLLSSGPLAPRPAAARHPRCLPFSNSLSPVSASEPPRRGSCNSQSISPPHATSGLSPLPRVHSGPPATLPMSPRAQQPFMTTQPQSAECASPKGQDALLTPNRSPIERSYDDPIPLIPDQDVPSAQFGADTEEAVASVLNAKLDFDEELLNETVDLHCRTSGTLEVSEGNVHHMDSPAATRGITCPHGDTHKVEISDSEDDMDHYIKFSQTVVVCEPSSDPAQAGLPHHCNSGTISQLDGADNGSESEAGEDDAQGKGTARQNLDEEPLLGDPCNGKPSSGSGELNSASEAEGSVLQGTKEMEMQDLTLAPVVFDTITDLVQEEVPLDGEQPAGAEDNILLDRASFVSADDGTVVCLNGPAQSSLDNRDSSSTDSTGMEEDVATPVTTPTLAVASEKPSVTIPPKVHIIKMPPTKKTRTTFFPHIQPQNKIIRLSVPVNTTVPVSVPVSHANTSSAFTLRTIPLKTSAPCLVNGFGPLPSNQGAKVRPIAIRLAAPKATSNQQSANVTHAAAAAACGGLPAPQILLVNRLGQILVRDPKNNTYQRPNMSPPYNNISQIAKVIHSGHMLPRQVPKILMTPVTLQQTGAAQSRAATTHLISYTNSGSNRIASAANVWVRQAPVANSDNAALKMGGVKIKNVTKASSPLTGCSQEGMAQAIIDKAMASHRNAPTGPSPSLQQPLFNKRTSPEHIAALPAILSRSHPQVRVKRVSSASERVGVKKCKADFVEQPPLPPQPTSEADLRYSGVRMKTPTVKGILDLDQQNLSAEQQLLESKRVIQKEFRPVVPENVSSGQEKPHVWVSSRHGDLTDWGPYSGLSSDDESTPPKQTNEKSVSKDQPHLRFEITSDDGFSVEADSIEVAWRAVIDAVQEARSGCHLKQLPLGIVSGARMLGVLHDAVMYLLEQLEGAAQCQQHRFRFHLHEKHEEELPVNPNGCARAEIYERKSTFDMFNFLASQHRKLPDMTPCDEEEDDMTLKSTRRATSTELPMAMRFRHLEKASKEAVGVYRSLIHGRGLFCKRNIEAGEMVIEYAGNVIRSVLTDKREKYYDGKGIGCYMFRIDDFDVVDATMHGNAARFINHSCEPNCYSRVIHVEGQKHIVIFALRKIYRGEELTYDYKFPIEDASNKLGCNCGARRCRRFLN
ncbi:uncharacterized protein kmt2ba isoform X2 [Denticeps clupeoides]|uniref:uncharacterized protein kmt2ba isoform X2 n=1 Tax=Denticeps clupeoides TaxID=299321 RepID=UPI0010A3B7E1|nr:uncharacterized protein LOC114770058 isoform X2 [Denticeps clupeoides]